MPRFRHANPGPNVVAHPLPAHAALDVGEDVEAHLRPVVNALGDLDGFVYRLIRWSLTVDDVLLSSCGEIRVQLHHRCARRNGVGGVNLDLVIALCFRLNDHNSKEQERQSKPAHFRAVYSSSEDSDATQLDERTRHDSDLAKGSLRQKRL